MLVVMMIEDMLADLGCMSVTSVATVVKALALIDAQDFDVALLDMNLNGNDSHPVAEALVARGVPLIYSTGNTDHSLRYSYSDRPILKKPPSGKSPARVRKLPELATILMGGHRPPTNLASLRPSIEPGI